MSRKIILRPPSSNRVQPLLKSSSCVTATRFGEVVGGTTAECAAICCCCPFGLANFIVLAFYKVPAGLCRRALRNKRRKYLIKKGIVPTRHRRCPCGCDETEVQIHSMCVDDLSEIKSQVSRELDKEALALEKEMWDRFYSTGFWRSPSQRESSKTMSASSSLSSLRLVAKDATWER